MASAMWGPRSGNIAHVAPNAHTHRMYRGSGRGWHVGSTVSWKPSSRAVVPALREQMSSLLVLGLSEMMTAALYGMFMVFRGFVERG